MDFVTDPDCRLGFGALCALSMECVTDPERAIGFGTKSMLRSGLRRGQHQWGAAGDDDRVLGVGRGGPVGGAHRPAVAAIADGAAAGTTIGSIVRTRPAVSGSVSAGT